MDEEEEAVCVLKNGWRKEGKQFVRRFVEEFHVYHLTVSILRRYRKHKDGWNYGIAGGIAGLSLALEAHSRRKTLAFFVAARALGAGATTLVARDLVRSIPHAETLTFCVCCATLVTCVARFPHLLPQGYYRSVVKWSRDYSHDILDELFRRPNDRFLTCNEVGMHQGACTRHALEDFVRSLPGFAKLYLPIHLAPVLVFKRAMLQKKPQYVLTSLAKNLTCSTLFISTMRVSRRKELVLFLIPQLLNALLVLVKNSRRGRDVHVPHGFVLLFAVAMGVVMHAHEREPKSLSMLMTGVLKFFVGPPREGRARVGQTKPEQGDARRKRFLSEA
nr:hypothetical protein BaRGS_013763 [Batillaria attramentaria]